MGAGIWSTDSVTDRRTRTDAVWLGESPRGGREKLTRVFQVRGQGWREKKTSRPGGTRGAVMRCLDFIPDLICPDRVPRAVWQR